MPRLFSDFRIFTLFGATAISKYNRIHSRINHVTTSADKMSCRDSEEAICLEAAGSDNVHCEAVDSGCSPLRLSEVHCVWCHTERSSAMAKVPSSVSPLPNLETRKKA